MRGGETWVKAAGLEKMSNGRYYACLREHSVVWDTRPPDAKRLWSAALCAAFTTHGVRIRGAAGNARSAGRGQKAVHSTAVQSGCAAGKGPVPENENRGHE